MVSVTVSEEDFKKSVDCETVIVFAFNPKDADADCETLVLGTETTIKLLMNAATALGSMVTHMIGDEDTQIAMAIKMMRQFDKGLLGLNVDSTAKDIREPEDNDCKNED